MDYFNLYTNVLTLVELMQFSFATAAAGHQLRRRRLCADLDNGAGFWKPRMCRAVGAQPQHVALHVFTDRRSEILSDL